MLTQSIVERIKGAIETGALRAGSAIGQQQLADQLGVSRQPIRQALPLLIAEGWIESLPNRRLLVRELASSEVDEIFAVRRLLEPVALAASIAHATPAMLRRVNFALTEYEAADTPAELESADVAFHEALYSCCDNTTLLRLIEQLRRSLKRVYELKPTGSALRKAAIAEHRKLAALCERGDARGASAVLITHLDAAQAAMRKATPAQAGKVTRERR
ncbi:MAG TPA: GntR family transcriptional regulator [Steroidobacteraceae bacterium]|jgi:DNA-binding GntR family transcriptional regulator|nr:GntR family transcriptional regulator [Steroidobacteraceae bacterium]